MRSRSCEVWLSKTYKNAYHQVDEFRGSPTRVNSGLSDRAYPVDAGGKPVNPNPVQDDKDDKDKKDESVLSGDGPDDPNKKDKGGKKPAKPPAKPAGKKK